jgi:low affinity Fe/Cu permease
MFIVAALINILEYFLVPVISNYDPNILVFINIGLSGVLIFLEIFLIDNIMDTKDLHLQEIEFNVLKNTRIE